MEGNNISGGSSISADGHGCPVEVLVDGAHHVDSTHVRAFGDVFRTECGSNTVRHQNSVFHDWLKQVPWDEFDRLIAEHGADVRGWRLSTKSQLIALLYGLAETTCLIDDTGVRLTAAGGWARFSARACGAKRHVVCADAGVSGLSCLGHDDG